MIMEKPHKKPHDRWGKERTLHVPVVGVQYRVTPLDQERIANSLPLRVDLVREPTNGHDPNAIKVVLAEQFPDFHIGYLPRGIAATLAPKLDDNQIWLEASALMELEGGSGQVLISLRKKIRSNP